MSLTHRPIPKSPPAFSLVELLVAVAIVVVLVACVMSAMPSVRSLTMKSQCSSNLRQIAMGLIAYSQEHEGRLPGAVTPTYGNTEGIWFSYAQLITPYLGMDANSTDPRIFTCPVNGSTTIEHPHYLFNSGNEYQPTFPGLGGKRLLTITQPTRTVLAMEMAAIFPVSWHNPQKTIAPAYRDALAMTAFADGHVSYIAYYWSGSGFSVSANPPAGYEYKLDEH